MQNWPAFLLWRDVWRQWRWVPGGLGGAQRDGLDWAQVESAMRLRRVPVRERARLMDALAIMQEAALARLGELRARDA